MTVGLDISPTDAQSFEAAIKYAVLVASRWHTEQGIYIPDIDPGAKSANDMFAPVFQSTGYVSSEKPKFVGYDVAKVTAREWQDAYLSSRSAALVIERNLSTNLFFGFKMPEGAMIFVSAFMHGDIRKPKKATGKPPRTHRDTLLTGIAKRVSGDFHFDLGAAKVTYVEAETPPIRACTIAAAGLFAFDHFVSPERADTIARSKKYPVDLASKNGVFFPAGAVDISGQYNSLRPRGSLDASSLNNKIETAKSYFSSSREIT